MTAPEDGTIHPFDIDRFASLFYYIHASFVDLIKRIPMDEDGDVAPVDGEALHSDLLCLLYDIEAEMDQLIPLISYRQ